MSEDIVIQTTDTTVDITSGESVDIDTTETTIDIDGDQSVDISVEESTVEIEVTGGQGPPGEGDVSSAAAITDNAIVRGDGGSKGVQDSGILIDDSDNITGVNDLAIGGTLTHKAKIINGGTSDYNLAATESGATIYFNGAGGTTLGANLPAAAVGLEYELVNSKYGAADAKVKFVANTGNYIVDEVGASSAAGSITSPGTTAGYAGNASIKIRCVRTDIVGGIWQVISKTGTWTLA